MREAETILVCHSDEATLTFLADNLSADLFDVQTATAVKEARLKLDHHFADLVVCGPLESASDQLTLLREVRGDRAHPALPFVALVPSGDELALLRSFEAGANDVVGQPFSYPELLARVRARVKPYPKQAQLCLGALTIRPASREALVGGRQLALTRLEFGLLHRLACEPGAVVAKLTLLREVWGYQLPAQTRSVDANACRLRRKLEAAGMHGAIDNVRGVGYRLVAGPRPQSHETGAPGQTPPPLALVESGNPASNGTAA